MADMITIIHLSDLHYSSKLSWQQNAILSTLKVDLETRIAQLKLENVYVVISGDISFSGEKNQFDLVRTFVDDLYKMGVKKIIVSPGNHDLDRKNVSSSHITNFESLIKGYPDAELKIEGLFNNEWDRAQFRKSMENYYNFIKEIGLEDDPYLYSRYSQETEGTIVNFLSFNSAYLYVPNGEQSSTNEYYGYIGRQQIERATYEAQFYANEKRSRVFNVCIFHHPFDAMPQAVHRNAEDLLKRRCNVILTGHVHHLGVSVDLTAQVLGPESHMMYPIISSSRCVYDEVNDPFTQPGYSILRLMLDRGKQDIEVDVYEIGFDKNSQQWFSISGDKPFPIDFRCHGDINRLKEFGYKSYVPTLISSAFSPHNILADPQVKSIDFLGIFASKWVMPDTLNLMSDYLSRSGTSARFLLLDFEGNAFKSFNESRKNMLSTEVFKIHKGLLEKYDNYDIRLFNELPKYRILIINNDEIGFSMHELIYDNYIRKRNEWDSSLLVFNKREGELTLFDLYKDYFERVWNSSRKLVKG